MGPVFVTIFAALLSCSNGIGTSHNGNESGLHHQSGQMKLLDLNFDILYLILHRLELNELLNVAETFPELSNIIDEVFRRKYLKNKPLIKVNINNRFESGPIGSAVKFANNTIRIDEREDCVYMLKHFGRFLQNINIIYITNNSSDVDVINQSLNKYCTKSLKQLQSDFPFVAFNLEKFTKPFEEVEVFTSYITEYELKPSQPLRLNEIFPNLRRLDITLDTADLNINFINGVFPHLNHFRLIVQQRFSDPKSVDLFKHLKETITKNPTIRSIEINLKYPKNFLKFLSQALPDLEHLKLNHFRIDNSETVQFKSLKKIVLNAFFPANMTNLPYLKLPHLESLEMAYLPGFFDEWRQFFKNHTHLKRLCIRENSNLVGHLPQLNALVATLPNLRDFTISIFSYNGIESVARLIRTYEQFGNVQFIFEERSQLLQATDVTALQQQYQNEWTIKGIENDNFIVGFSFERKHPI